MISWFILTCHFFLLFRNTYNSVPVPSTSFTNSLLLVNLLQNGSLCRCRFKCYTSVSCRWSGTSSTAKDSRSYRPYVPIDLCQYGWRTHWRRKAVTAVLFSTWVKDNILFYIIQHSIIILPRRCSGKIDLNAVLSNVENVCNAVGFKLGQSWEMYVSELSKMPWTSIFLTSLELDGFDGD